MHPDARHRLNVLRFREQHGTSTACDALQTSRRLQQANTNPAALIPRSRANWQPELVRKLRRLPCPSASTIGRIDAPLSHPPRRPGPAQARAPAPENMPAPPSRLIDHPEHPRL